MDNLSSLLVTFLLLSRCWIRNRITRRAAGTIANAAVKAEVKSAPALPSRHTSASVSVRVAVCRRKDGETLRYVVC